MNFKTFLTPWIVKFGLKKIFQAMDSKILCLRCFPGSRIQIVPSGFKKNFQVRIAKYGLLKNYQIMDSVISFLKKFLTTA